MRHALLAACFVSLLTGCPAPGPMPVCSANRYSMMHDFIQKSPTPRCVAFSADGKTLAVGTGPGESGSVELRDVADLKRIKKFATDFEVHQIAFAPDGGKLFVQGMYSRGNGSLPPTAYPRACLLDPVSGKMIDQSTVGLNALVLSSDGQSTVHLTDNAGEVETRPTFSATRQPATFQISSQQVEQLALTSDRRLIAFVEDDNKIRVCELEKQTSNKVDDHTIQVRDVPGRASITDRRRSPSICRQVAKLDGHKHRVHQIQFSPNGKRLISASGVHFQEPVEVIVWDIATQRIHLRLPDLADRFNRFVLSPDGRYLAVGTISVHTTVTLWDLHDGKKIRAFDNLAWNTPVAFTPDGARLALVESSGAIRMEEIASTDPATRRDER